MGTKATNNRHLNNKEDITHRISHPLNRTMGTLNLKIKITHLSNRNTTINPKILTTHTAMLIKVGTTTINPRTRSTRTHLRASTEDINNHRTSLHSISLNLGDMSPPHNSINNHQFSTNNPQSSSNNHPSSNSMEDTNLPINNPSMATTHHKPNHKPNHRLKTLLTPTTNRNHNPANHLSKSQTHLE